MSAATDQLRLAPHAVQRVAGQPVSFRAIVSLEGRERRCELSPIAEHDDGSVTYRLISAFDADRMFALD